MCIEIILLKTVDIIKLALIKKTKIMKEKISKILVSKNFTDWLKNPEIVQRIVEGGRGTNQREIILRNEVFDELDLKYPGVYRKELRRHDISDPASKTTIEFGHNGLWQPSIYHINKPISDFYKRANSFKHFYYVHFITDIIVLDSSHKIGKSYLMPSQYSLGILRTIKNRNIARYNLDTIKDDFERLDLYYNIHNFQNLNCVKTAINIYAIIIGPFIKGDWSKIQKTFDGELDIVENDIE